MSQLSNSAEAPRILCVDDDTLTLRIVEVIVRRAGYRVLTAKSVPEARVILQQKGEGPIDGVVTDYSMPGETGLDLVRWIRETDPALAAILVTAAGDGEVVRDSLREGVVDFLDKPVRAEPLVKALKKAVELTRRRREELDRAHAVRHLGDVHAQMLELSGVDHHPRCRLFFRALRETGGDFVTHHPLVGANGMVLMADVSGHDLKDAYLGAVFQGMLRGFIVPETSLDKVFARLHHFLIHEWNPAARRRGDSRGTASVAICGVYLDEAQGRIRVLNAGQPSPRLTRDGWTETLGTGAPPLGWFDDLESDDFSGELGEGVSIGLWTDGLQDLADRYEVDPLAAAYRLCPPRGQLTSPLPAAEFTDDVLVLQIDLGPDDKDPEAWFPLVSHTGNGTEAAQIDALQHHWERSLKFTEIGLSEAAAFDILLCAREAALNAIRHGCRNEETKEWSLQIHFNPHSRMTRVSVRDPGDGWPGAAYLELPREEILDGDEDRHAGLVLLRRLPSHVAVSRSGAWLRLNFEADRPMKSFA